MSAARGVSVYSQAVDTAKLVTAIGRHGGQETGHRGRHHRLPGALLVGPGAEVVRPTVHGKVGGMGRQYVQVQDLGTLRPAMELDQGKTKREQSSFSSPWFPSWRRPYCNSLVPNAPLRSRKATADILSSNKVWSRPSHRRCTRKGSHDYACLCLVVRGTYRLHATLHSSPSPCEDKG